AASLEHPELRARDAVAEHAREAGGHEDILGADGDQGRAADAVEAVERIVAGDGPGLPREADLTRRVGIGEHVLDRIFHELGAGGEGRRREEPEGHRARERLARQRRARTRGGEPQGVGSPPRPLTRTTGSPAPASTKYISMSPTWTFMNRHSAGPGGPPTGPTTALALGADLARDPVARRDLLQP